VDCAGLWGATCGSSVPDVRNHFRLTWLTRWRVRPSLTRRYISAADGLNATAIDLGARHYVDVSARWDYSDSDSLRAGINNLFDRPPPIAGAAAGPSHFGNGYTFPDLYDALGRYAFMAVSVVLP
jgi:outer membrane receptor protein involved in Fe transport